MHCHLRLVMGDKHDAFLAVAHVRTDPLGHLRPQAVSGQGQWNIVRVAAGLAHPAQVARGLLAGDTAFFQNHHRDIAFGQCQCSAQADNAAADDDNGGGGGKLGGRIHGRNSRGHDQDSQNN